MNQILVTEKELVAAMAWFSKLTVAGRRFPKEQMATLAEALGMMHFRKEDHILLKAKGLTHQALWLSGQKPKLLEPTLEMKGEERDQKIYPATAPAKWRGYSVIKVFDDKPYYVTTTPADQVIGGSEIRSFEAAWVVAMQDYLASMPSVELGDELDIGQALDDDRIFKLPNEDGFFVLNEVFYPSKPNHHFITGWRIDQAGLKNRTGPAASEGAHVMLSNVELRELNPDEVQSLRACPRHTFISGKGTVNCSVQDERGVTFREVSMKSRLDLSDMKIIWIDEPFLVFSTETSNPPVGTPLSFDPFTQADVITGERYNHFCFIDDGGVVLDVDPQTQIARPQEPVDDAVKPALTDVSENSPH